jgi:predicted NAD/FAD-dependent oxidoreductase
VSPIVTVTLWFDAPVLPAPMVGLLAPRGGSPPAFQWAFDRAHHVKGPSGTWPVALVGSAADDIATRPTAELLALAAATLAAYGITTRVPLAGRVVKEPRATPAFDPAADRVRPAEASGRAGLAFAGDWTATGLPATLEGAVRSGRAAARQLLSSGILSPST